MDGIDGYDDESYLMGRLEGYEHGFLDGYSMAKDEGVEPWHGQAKPSN